MDKTEEKRSEFSDELAAYYFHQGTNTYAYDYMGVHRLPAVAGRYRYVFRVYAFRAVSVSIVGDFSGWQAVPMERETKNGVWRAYMESDIPFEGMRYKYQVTSAAGAVVLKADPYARSGEWGIRTASIVCTASEHVWEDGTYMQRRRAMECDRKNGFWSYPMNIYEVHLGSFMTRDDRGTAGGDAYLSYRELGDRLAEYVGEMGYTHVELMPIAEYPYDASWGYQITGYFAPTSRYGRPDDLRYMVDRLHRAGIGVILDWVPAHFPGDIQGLADFDGSRMYEYQGDDRVSSRTWGTRFFDVGRPEVQSFLISNALYWLREFHIDGLRADAVASMLYLDYDRRDGEWIPNPWGGNQNQEAIAFFKKLNCALFEEFPDALMIAEESTAFPLVTHPVHVGGLGFNFKWNMGWMNDVLDYMRTDPLFRRYKRDKLTFSLMYAFSENFILPLSHDEVVHGKKSLIDKMFGTYEQKFAGVRLFFAYQMAHPGKKLTFMGCEFGQFREWDFENPLEWFLCEFEMHEKLRVFVRELNGFYRREARLWQVDFSWNGFDWVHEGGGGSADTADVLAFKRFDAQGHELLAVFNFSPIPVHGYRCAVGGRHMRYRLLFNTDDRRFGGRGQAVAEEAALVADDAAGGEMYLPLTLPPLSALFLEPVPAQEFLTERMQVRVERG